METLQKSQALAFSFVKEWAAANRSAVRERSADMLRRDGVSWALFDNALAAIAANAPIDVNFHPDRPDANGNLVVESLLSSGQYKNQFETGISNGGLTAFEGGARDVWEQRLFGGAYQQANAVTDRPKYGAMNLLNHWDGACPRFGCCYFRLTAAVAERCTFAFGDSSTEPNNIGTVAGFEAVLCAALEAIQATGQTLGGKNLQTKQFLSQIPDNHSSQSALDFAKAPSRNLDQCIEVHVHGAINLATDVEYLVVDGAFRESPTGSRLVALGARYGFKVHWNPGFYLAASQVPSDFRGSVMVPLANHIATDGVVDAVNIGQAVVSLRENPEAWQNWGTFDETLQYLKQMWHVLITFGGHNPQV